MLNRRKLYLFIHTLIILITMSLKQFILANKSKLLKFLFFIVAIIAIYTGVRRISSHSLVIGHPSEIIVISPENSQDVIVIGDPDKINVKPKKK